MSRNYKDKDDTWQLSATLTWINGKFEGVSLRNEICGMYLIIRSSSGVVQLKPNGLIALRELMQEVVITTNNPPVGCEPI